MEPEHYKLSQLISQLSHNSHGVFWISSYKTSQSTHNPKQFCVYIYVCITYLYLNKIILT